MAKSNENIEEKKVEPKKVEPKKVELKKVKEIKKIYIGPSFNLNGRTINHGSSYIFKTEEEVKTFVKNIGIDLVEKALIESTDICKKIGNINKRGTKEHIISNSILKKIKEIKDNQGGVI